VSLVPGAFTEKKAVEYVEEAYGSMENFAIFCLTEGTKVLDSAVGVVERAKIAGLPVNALAYLITKSPKFRLVMRSAIANTQFGLLEEQEHVQTVVGIARNKGRKVVTNKGNTTMVDNTERGIIDAGRYLNELRGTPLDSSQKGVNVGVNVVFGQAEAALDHDPGRTITVAGHQINPHKPLRAGALPPSGALSRYQAGATGHGSGGAAGPYGSDLDFTSAESPTAENVAPPPRRQLQRSGAFVSRRAPSGD
jgi:hypothetical protein